MQEVHNVAILGAGFGGLGMAARLKAEGEESFVILEKADRVGGTWRDNTYPGAACDVKSHLYWFSFDEQPDWSRLYGEQPEILANIERLVERHDLARHIRFNAEVVEARWDDAASLWRMMTAAGDEMVARAFVTAWGQLNRPTFGGIKGLESFKGVAFHSSRWRHDVDLKGKRVACIGNGASAVQFIPAIVKEIGQLTVFQRSANYILPRLDRPYSEEERRAFKTDPALYQTSREGFYQEHESWYEAMRQGTATAKEFTAAARAQLEAQIQDPVLREKLWPDYPIGCKRILITDDFYPALTRAYVALVTERVVRVEPEGVRTADGQLHAVDMIIFATGFETVSLLGVLDILGRGERSLRDAWSPVPEAHLGLTVAGFPNLFMLYGPNTNLGHNSIIAMLECQFGYVLQALRAMREHGADAINVRAEAMARYNRELQQAFQGMAWAGSCTSWYKTADGRITNNWSGSVEDYKRRTAQLDLAEYELIRRDLPIAS